MKTDIKFHIKQKIHSARSHFEYHYLQNDPIFQEHCEKLRAFENRHKGKRCFIIGNGPSLNNTDLTRLKDEFTFGLNRIYLLFDSLRFSTTYYVCTNRLVLSQFQNEISMNVPVSKFSVWDQYDIAKDIPDIHFIYRHNAAGFYSDITKGVWGGTTVTYVAMQIAYHLGFHDVILIGVDHSFTTQGTPHKVLESRGDDPNHFSPNYFGKGVRWQLPDLNTSEYAYSLARQHFEEAGRTIKDATIGGKLQVFPKVDYYSLWD